MLILLAAMGSQAAAQDIITKKDATEIQAKVIKVGTSEIEYKQWSNPEGPVYTVPIEEVFTIKYENGQRDVLSQVEGKHTSKNNRAASTEKFKAHYEGDVAVGYLLSFNDPGYSDCIVFETVHGIRILPYLFTGIGVGLDYFFTYKPFTVSSKGQISRSGKSTLAMTLPVFFNVKGFYPVSDKFSVYASVDLGGCIGIKEFSGGSFYTSVGPGIQVGRKKAFDFSLRYQYRGKGSDAMLARFGFRF